VYTFEEMNKELKEGLPPKVSEAKERSKQVNVYFLDSPGFSQAQHHAADTPRLTNLLLV
jgi:hypothetical protein